MLALYVFTRRSKMGKAMRGHRAGPGGRAHDGGWRVDRVIMTRVLHRLGPWPGQGGMIFGLYYNFTSFVIGYSAGLRAFTAAVLGRHRQRAGRPCWAA